MESRSLARIASSMEACPDAGRPPCWMRRGERARIRDPSQKLPSRKLPSQKFFNTQSLFSFATGFAVLSFSLLRRCCLARCASLFPLLSIRGSLTVVKSAALEKSCYPQVPGSIPAESTSTPIHMDLSN